MFLANLRLIFINVYYQKVLNPSLLLSTSFLTMPSLSGLEQLRAAAIDCRTENVRYRQNEIQRLHSCLRENATAILSSIFKDSDGSSSTISIESEAEYWMTMNAVEEQHDGLDFEASIKQEYLIVTGANNQSRRIGMGVVVIRPTTHTRFYSIIVPLVTAMAAGSCTALEVRLCNQIS